jgi:dTDP-4-dehydrorhamnose 3,5-epimerase
VKFVPLSIGGVILITPELARDDRGTFARTYCREEFLVHGLDPAMAQCSQSTNAKRGTLRGMHMQRAPFGETKLVRCTQGAIFDVVIDLRPRSPTYTRWASAELSRENGHALYVPEGMAHGYVTLQDESDVYYQISVPFRSDAAIGVRWDDPVFGIEWPGEVAAISERDRQYPDFVP